MTAPSDLSRLTEILNKAGAEALAFFNGMAARQVVAKAPGDLVSDADRAVEMTQRRLLERAFLDCEILGEEYGGEPEGRFWAVDPIDGTSNFLSGLPFWTISLGLMDWGQPILGGIIAPAMGLLAVGGPARGLQITGLTAGSRPEAPPVIGIGRNRGGNRGRRPCPPPDRLFCPIPDAGRFRSPCGLCRTPRGRPLGLRRWAGPLSGRRPCNKFPPASRWFGRRGHRCGGDAADHRLVTLQTGRPASALGWSITIWLCTRATAGCGNNRSWISRFRSLRSAHQTRSI